MFQVDACVIANKKLKSNFAELLLESEQVAAAACPGQFVHVHCPVKGIFFRRPFSIAGVKGKRFFLLYRALGPGTEYMSKLKPGDKLNVLGPLGRAYPAVKNAQKVIFIAGGSGIASLYFLAQHIKPGVLYFGARSKDEIVYVEKFKEKKWEVRVSTDDGSCGSKGFVSELCLKDAAENFNAKSIVYMCGPGNMEKVAAEFLQRQRVKFYASIENLMACGVGVCQGCAVKRKNSDSYALVCKDGPVFEGSEIDWEKM